MTVHHSPSNLKRIEGGPFLRLRGVLAGFFMLKKAVVRDGPRLRVELDGEAALLGYARFHHPR